MKSYLNEGKYAEGGIKVEAKKQKILLSRDIRVATVTLASKNASKCSAHSSSNEGNTVNINGREYQNRDNIENQAPETNTSNECNLTRRVSVNHIDIKSRRSEAVNLLINRVNEDKLEHDQWKLATENIKNDTRTVYERWTESFAKKRKIGDIAYPQI